MSLLDTIKSGAKTAWRGIKNFFTGDTYSDTVKNDTDQDTGKETLNQQIANGNINKNTTQATTPTMVSGFDILKENLNAQQTPTVTTQKASVTNEDKEEDNFLSKLGNWIYGASSSIESAAEGVSKWTNNLINSKKKSDEYDSLEEMYAVGYNPDNRNVYYLDLNEDRGLFDWDFGTHEGVRDEFERLLSEADMKYNMPGATELDKAQAYQEFYDKAKKLFRIRADDRYSNGIFGATKYGRRDESYTQDQLDMLANGNTEKGRYEPTLEEFQDFVAMYLRNKNTQQELGIKYRSPDNEEENIELSNAQSDWMEKNSNIAMKGIEEYFAPMDEVNPQAAMDAKLTYKASVLNNRLGRRYNQVAPIYKDEQEVLSRDSSTWSWQDKYILAQAEKARQLDAAYAENINELLRQTLLYGTNKRGDIVNTPDIFENGESLNDVLTKNLREIAGEDKSRYSEHQSPLDIVQNFANNAHYIYKQDKVGAVKRAWNSLEYLFEPVGSTLGEVGQAAWALGMDVVGVVSMGTLYDGLTKSYMDQDATVFRLMETDDSNIGRTIKKYYLDVTEYTPEVLGNLAPDIALYAATGPGALATTARHLGDVSRAYKATKAAEGASLLNKLRVINLSLRGEEAAEALGMSARTYSNIINATKATNGGKPYQVIKTGAELLDRAVTQLGLGQFMDAQWSAYDTEPYSQASFLMSIIGSATFDIMPEVVRLTTGRHRWNLLTGKYGDNIWDLAKYIDSSPEAAENIAKVLRKGTGELTFDDLKSFVRSYGAIEDAAKQAYNQLKPAEKAAIGDLTKTLTYSYINQAFGANSTVGKRVRQILQNKNTNIADVIKYLGNIPGEVSVGPYISTIRFKNGTRANVFTKNTTGEYDPVLDSIFSGGFDSRIKNGFSQADLDTLSETKGYSNLEKNKGKWFNEVTDENGKTTYYLTKEGLDRFGFKPESITLESLGVTLKEAENTREALNNIKGVESVKISDKAIDYLAETGAYDEITGKVRELLGC